MEKLSFVAIDFETMTSDLSSPCSVGLVKVVNNVIYQQFYSLIKFIPKEGDKLNTFVHGITPEMIANAPTMEDIWPLMMGMCEGIPLVCHNKNTDIKIIDYFNDHVNQPEIEYSYVVDTLDLCHMSLTDACKQYNITLESHHNALSDAMACAELYLALNDIHVEKHVYQKKKMSTKEYYGNKKVNPDTLKLLPDEEIVNKDNPFYHKKIVLTGNLKTMPKREKLCEMLQKLGADINTSISSKTDMVIIGENPGPSKMDQIIELKKSGVDIQIIDEITLIRMFGIKI